jgi:hypothetical protein
VRELVSAALEVAAIVLLACAAFVAVAAWHPAAGLAAAAVVLLGASLVVDMAGRGEGS